MPDEKEIDICLNLDVLAEIREDSTRLSVWTRCCLGNTIESGANGTAQYVVW